MKKVRVFLISNCLMVACALVFLPLVVGTASPAAKEETHVLKFAGFGGPGYFFRKFQEDFMRIAEKKSDGKIKFDYYPAESLVKFKDGFDACRNNVVHLAGTCAAYEPDRLGIASAATTLPGNWDCDKFGKHYRDPGGFKDLTDPLWERNGLILLSWVNTTNRQLFCTEPIRGIKDLNGLLLRTNPGPEAEGVKILGAQAVHIPTAELYTALQRGTIDGGTRTLGAILTKKFYEVAKYISIWDFNSGSCQQITNPATMKKLGPELSKILEDAALEAERLHFDRQAADREANLEALKEIPGVEIINWSEQEKQRARELMKPLYEELAEKFGDKWDEFRKIQEKLW
jgi:C4-dicarboxylate-binding protein DctP